LFRGTGKDPVRVYRAIFEVIPERTPYRDGRGNVHTRPGRPVLQMLLHPGEQILRTAYAVLKEPHGPTPRRTKGVLYLTTQRLVFEVPSSRGVVRDLVGGRDTHLAVDRPLHDLRNVSVRRGRFARPALVIDMGRARVVVDVLETDGWSASIAAAKGEIPSMSPAVPAATHTVERQVVKVRCRHCGTLANEVDGRCPACGAPL
jgi:hypothetical protein